MGNVSPNNLLKLKVMNNLFCTVPIGTVGYWRSENGSPIIRKARFMWLTINAKSACFSEVRYCWEIAGIGLVTERVCTTYDVSEVNNGIVYMSYEGADNMEKEDILRNRVVPTDLISLFRKKYKGLSLSSDANNSYFYAWKIDGTNQAKRFCADSFVDVVDGQFTISIPMIDNGEAFITKEECLAHREKCQLIDFENEEPTKKELLDQWLDKQQMSLDELRDIING